MRLWPFQGGNRHTVEVDQRVGVHLDSLEYTCQSSGCSGVPITLLDSPVNRCIGRRAIATTELGMLPLMERMIWSMNWNLLVGARNWH